MTDEGVPHVRLGRSRLLQKEELMYGEAVYHQKPIVERHRVTPRRIDSPQQRHPESLSHPNNAIPRRQPKPRVKYQRQTPNQYSSSDESAPRAPNKCKSTSSIDTQSVNNILDEFEDLDCSGTSDSSLSITNFESMMNQRRKQRIERQVTKVNQQTQVRQRSRDRTTPKVPEKAAPITPKPVPELLLRKGEVQKRVDEWLIQSQSQSQSQSQHPATRVSLTRSTSSAEQKTRPIPPETRLNGTTSCDDLNSDHNSQHPKIERVSIGVNTGPVNYRDYLRSKMKIDNDTVTPMTSRIPQRQTDKNSRIKYKQSNGPCRLTSRHSFKRTSSGDRSIPNKVCESRPVRQNKVEEIVQRVEKTAVQCETDDNNSRRPPAPPRRYNRSDLSSCSSFKPNKTVVNGVVSGPHYARDVEKIYEKSLRPEVIHADDLRAVLEPSVISSAYGESYRSEDTVTNGGSKNYPEIGLDQCLRIQRRLPKNSTFDRRDCPKDETFQKKALMNSEENEPTYETLENVLKDSYEAMSTLKLDRHLADIEDEKFDVKGNDSPHRETVNGENKMVDADSETCNAVEDETKVSVNEVLVKNLCFHQDLPQDSRSETFRPVGVTSYQKPFNFNSVLSDDYEARIREASKMQECKIYVTKEEMERQRLMDLLRKRDYDAVKVSSGTRGSPEGGGGGVGMCCVLQGADRVCPSTAGDKHNGNSSVGNCGTPVTIHDLPLESLWAAGLDDGMGFPQRCSYSNHHTIPTTPSTNPEETWRDRNPPYRTPTTSTGIGSSITDEIWTSASERKFFRTSTTSTGIGSSLNLHENNRSLESHDDFYPTDDDKDNARRLYYQTTPTTSGIGSSIEKTQSIGTPRSQDIPDHLWSGAMEGGFARYNAVKSLQTITRQPRPNHDWVKTERIARFTKHRTISQSPDFHSEDIWTSRLNENGISGYGTQRNHRCQHQTRRSFSTSIMADLAGTPSDSQQSLGSAEFLELERSYTLSTPGGGSPVCCPPCSPPPAPAAYISSIRASSRKFGGSGPTSPDRDPVGRLLRYLKMYYRELGTRDPRHLPPWILPLPLGTLCPAHFQPHLQLMHKNDQEHRLESIKIDQIFATVRLSDGLLSEAPRRVAIEGGPGSGRTTLCMRLLHQWASKDDGPALAFIIPLRELRGTSVLNYLTREFLSKSASLTEAMAQVWRTLHLLEDRVLFILDGYDECPGGRQSLADAVDLLEARLFPDARILVTCSPNNWTSLSPMVQRRIHLAGLEWPHVERLCVAYFIHNNLSERACDFLECLSLQSQIIKELVQHPLGWIMMCTLYQDSGTLPSQPSAVVQEAVKSIIRKCLDRPLTPDEELPSHCRKRLEDFGKLSLSALREGRCCYTESEIRTRGGGIEILRLGFLSRGFTFGQRRKIEQYTPIHMAIAEFLAAYYLASISQYANILRREIEGLPSGIIGYLAGLLGPRTHLVLNQLCPLEVPSRTIFSLLKAAGTSDGNILAVCRLLGAAPGFGPVPNERPPAPLVQTSPLELEGWSKILGSGACTLEALEVVFQVERGADPTYLNDFFKALADNESVKLVRITSLLGQEFPADEAQRLAGHLKSVLSKKRLNDFELVITCLEESAHDRLECVVNALCRGLSNASSHLARLVLDMNLSGDQVSRVCTALRDCVQVQALHLPHLSCGCEGLASVAELLKERPLLALNLAGSWGAKNEDPSSSGISMGSGSGSGSSGCASSTLGTLPLNNRCYSSLPRGALAAYGSLTRPATLPRLPLGIGLGTSGNGNGTLPQNDRDRDSSNGSSKRNSDSVLCHRLPLMHPLPTCDVACHQGTGFHEIFNAIREPNCKLRSLNVSKCLQGGLDAGCLGETIRRARNLDAVRAAGASRPADVMPLVLALTEAPCLQLLDLASPRLAMDDHPSRLLCHALARNSTLRLLSLEGWTFRIEESDTLSVFSELLMCTSVRELSLCNARLHLAVHEGPLSRLGRRDDAGAELLRAAPPPACPTIVFLRLAGFQVSVNDRLALRGPLLLPFLAGFTALSELDLSLDKSEIGGSSGSLLFIDDKILQQFFSSLSTHFRTLQTLKINYWRINLEDTDKTMRQISKHLKTSNVSFVKANGLIVTDGVKRQQVEHLFVQTLLANLQCLTWLCLDGVKLTESQCTSIGKWIKERYPGVLLEISAKDIQVRSIKALVAAVEEGGRAEIGYIGGSTCRIKINKLQKNSKTKKK